MIFKKIRKGKDISAKRTILTSSVVDFFDFVVNLILAIITGSVVMLAETIQGGADFISTIFLFIGLKRSSKRATKKHPLGYGRALYIWTFLVTVVMFLISSTLTFYFGLMRFLNPEPIDKIGLAYVVLFFFVISNSYAFSVSSRRLLMGEKYRNIIKVFKKSDLIETKTTTVLDFVGTSAALIGLIALVVYGITGNLKFDGIGAMGIGIVTMILALFLLIDTKSLLIGKNASEKIEKEIFETVKNSKEVNKILNLKTLNIGLGKIALDLELNLIDNLTTDDIEKVIFGIENKIKRKIPEVKKIYIEIRDKKTKISEK